jgi:hypothetical protein
MHCWQQWEKDWKTFFIVANWTVARAVSISRLRSCCVTLFWSVNRTLRHSTGGSLTVLGRVILVNTPHFSFETQANFSHRYDNVLAHNYRYVAGRTDNKQCTVSSEIIVLQSLKSTKFHHYLHESYNHSKCVYVFWGHSANLAQSLMNTRRT